MVNRKFLVAMHQLHGPSWPVLHLLNFISATLKHRL